MIKKDPRVSIIKSYRRQGFNYSQIAKKFEISKQRINQLINPQKHYARTQIVGLKRKPCEFPACVTEKTEAHHYDYSRPLEVNWLCIKHHKKLHVALRGNDVPKKQLLVNCTVCKKEVEYKTTQPKFCRDCAKKRVNKLHRKRYHTIPEVKTKQLTATRKWVKENREANRKIQLKATKKYNSTHTEELRLRRKLYYEKNREKFQAYFRERYLKKKESP